MAAAEPGRSASTWPKMYTDASSVLYGMFPAIRTTDPNSPMLAYDPEADGWRGIEGSAPTAGSSVWTGELVVGWSGRSDRPVTFRIED